VSPRLRTETPRHALCHLHPPQLFCEIWLFEWAWGELCAELSVAADYCHGDRRARSCRLSELYSCKILSWTYRRLWPRCVSVLPLIAGRGGVKTTRSLRCLWCLRSQQHPREPYSQAHGVCFFPHTPAVEPRRGGGNGHWVQWVLWIAHSVWRARVSSCSSNSTTSTVATLRYSHRARANDSQLVGPTTGPSLATSTALGRVLSVR
jgi:hypothetical protein